MAVESEATLRFVVLSELLNEVTPA
jgi:hypothetical protein